jgi:hypothetical protein
MQDERGKFNQLNFHLESPSRNIRNYTSQKIEIFLVTYIPVPSLGAVSKSFLGGYKESGFFLENGGQNFLVCSMF